MEILKSGYGISTGNYSKPTPTWIKWVGDGLFALGTLGEIAMPEFNGKQWVVFSLLACKWLSKFISEHIST